MKILNFLKPTKIKIISFFVILILSNFPFIGWTKTMISSPSGIIGVNFVNKFNPLLNPPFYFFGGEDDMPLAQYSHSGTGNIYYVLMFTNIVYWYLLSCLLTLGITKFKK